MISIKGYTCRLPAVLFAVLLAFLTLPNAMAQKATTSPALCSIRSPGNNYQRRPSCNCLPIRFT
jgi:hypothetical protein